MLRTLDQIYQKRRETIRREGSPYYPYACGVIAAAAQEAFNVHQQFPQSEKYKPLDELELVNNSPTEITLLVNGGVETYVIPAGGVRMISRKPVHFIQVQNTGAAPTVAGDVTLNLRRMPLSIDEVAREKYG